MAGHAVGLQRILNAGGVGQPHVEHQCLARCRQRRPLLGDIALLVVAGDELHSLGMIAVGEGNAAVGGAARRSSNARYHREGDARLGQGFQLLATPAKDKGIAPLEPHHLFAQLSLFQQQLVDRLLGHTVAARLLANKDPLGIPANKRQYLLRDQSVIDHHIRLLQLLQTAQGKQSRIAGAGAHQGHASLALWLLIEQLGDALFGSLLLAAGQLAGEALVAKEPLPEATAGQLVRNGLDPLAQLARQRRELAEVLRQHGFKFFPQLAAQYRRRACAGDGHHQRRAVDDGWHDGAAVGWGVHHIAEDLAQVRLMKDLLVDLLLVGGGDHQPLAIEQFGMKVGGADGQATLLGPAHQLGFEMRGIDGDLRLGIEQQARLAHRHFTAADDQDRLVLQLTEEREKVHNRLRMLARSQCRAGRDSRARRDAPRMVGGKIPRRE